MGYLLDYALRHICYYDAMPSSEDYAWAAGFWDGEGCVFFSRIRRVAPRQNEFYSHISARVTQKDRRILDRFAALFPFGSVHPTLDRKHDRTYWEWRISKVADLEPFLTLLWPYLGETKREQAERCIAAYHAVPDKRRRGNGGLRHPVL